MNKVENIVKKRIKVRWLLVLYDFLFTAFWGVFFFVIYGKYLFNNLIFPFIVSIAYLALFRSVFRVYTQIWRYGGIVSYLRIIVADGVAFVFMYVTDRVTATHHIPFTMLFSYFALILLSSLVIRLLYRYIYQSCHPDTFWGKIMYAVLRVFSGGKIYATAASVSLKKKIAIIGVGRVGVSFANELNDNPESKYKPVIFIDIDKEKIGRYVLNLPVIDEALVTRELLDSYGIQELVITFSENNQESKLQTYEKFKKLGINVKLYDRPLTQSMNNGKKIIRNFDIEELLFRNPIVVIDENVKNYYQDKVVLITGGGGSIGSELCRQIAMMSPKTLIVLDICENGIYEIQQELKMQYGDKLDLKAEIVSVCNKEAFERVFIKYKPQIVLHAAAHKHVPLMEHSPIEAIYNNVFGTLNAVELSDKYGVEHFIMISTDKAVNPTNVMGATKRMCEMIVMSYSSKSKTIFSATRFGNVLGSAGSVVPLFKKQIANGGPITLTDKRIIRYFMTIPEASQLVLASGCMSDKGELFVLDMGKPVKILDLAENIIELSGYVPYKDIDIVETGLRPGEKLYEELLIKTENLSITDNKLIFIERDESIDQELLVQKIALLREAIQSGDEEKAYNSLACVVPTFKAPEVVNAEVEKANEMQSANKAV